MKKMFLLVLVVIIALAGCGSKSEEADAKNSSTNGEKKKETIMFKFAHELQEGTPQHIGAMEFKKLVEEKSDGRMHVEVHPAAQLGSEKEVMEIMQTGGVETGMVTTAVLSNLSPAFQMIDLPFLFPNRESAYHILDGEIGDEILSTLDSYKLKGAAFFESGFKQFTSNKEIQSPGDIAGLKFRTMESPLIIDTYNQLGANPVPISFPEVYNALQQKVVDGHENPLSTITSMKFYEVQDYITISNHSYLGYAIVFSQKWFNNLPEDLQDVLTASAKEAATVERQAVVDKEKGYLDQIIESGTTVNELTSEQLSKFAKVTRPVHDSYKENIGAELLDKTYNAIEKFTK